MKKNASPIWLLIQFYRKFSHPNRKIICEVIKKTRIPHDSFYKELKFNWKFKVKLAKNKSFYMYNFGGSVETETFWKGAFTTWENDAGWLWMQLCRCCNVIFDVGANKGIYSLVAKTINPNARVYAFEPSVYTFDKMVKNIELNRFDISCERMAISNRSGNQVFYDVPRQNQTTASLSPDKMKNFEGYRGEVLEYKVPTISLSDYIEINNILAVDLIKIDIELHEPEAIEGLGKYLSTYKPIVFVEVLTEEIAVKLNELIDFENFKLFHLKKGAKPEPLSKFKTNKKALANWEWNYVLFHKDVEEKVQNNTSLY
jgi:FkbM family methyltransferase